MGTTQPPIQWVPGLSRWQRGRGVVLTIERNFIVLDIRGVPGGGGGRVGVKLPLANLKGALKIQRKKHLL